MKIATTIRQAIRGTTQRRLAARMRCSPSTVSRLVRGIDQFADLLAALDMELRE